MPYKDPKKQAAAVKKARAKWAAENPELVQRQQMLRHQKQLPKRRQQMRERSQAQGAKPRPKGTKARTEIVLPASRKWRIFTDTDGITRLYFTSKRGFELSEITAILKEFRAARTRHLEAQL